MKIAIERAGFLTMVQDLGRTARSLGVPAGGALDGHALKVANLLVGNEIGSAGLEITLGNLRLRFADERLVAWCGGEFSVHGGEVEIAAGRAALLRAGDELLMTAPARGGRAWLAISGGIDVPLVLGSRATDLRNHFGGYAGRALRDGDLIDLGQPSERARRLAASLARARLASWSAPHEWAETSPNRLFVRLIAGCDRALFDHEAWATLTQETFVVAQESDRMGVRLRGPEIMRRESADLISEAVAPGTLQVPPDGQPILLLGDCQTIGGYPKIAHVITVDLPAAAQLFPGDTIRFAEVSLAEAQQLLLEREGDLQRFQIGLELHCA